MNQKITFSTILVVLTLFFVCFTNAAPIEARAAGQVVYVDFLSPTTGRTTVTEWQTGKCRMLGQFNSGITPGTYELRVSGTPTRTISIPQALIYPPGIAAFQFDFDLTIQAFAGRTLSLVRTSPAPSVVVETRPFILVGGP
ncbi:10558_t:CDS:1 [Diversispora eburnea]|uniref:10558_t:CDS:1 n=1 Tax=Diversispora eburnea TaxID=1213867 RepID=A0A9N9AGM9_9GLOM|nr:10558_t:CDS:1 [Diversispora eburnea]